MLQDDGDPLVTELNLAEDSDGKRELETALKLIAAEALGRDAERLQVHLSAPSRSVADRRYRLGNVARTEIYPLSATLFLIRKLILDYHVIWPRY